MKKIVILLFVNVLLILYVFYVIDISSSDVKMGYLPDVYNKNLDSAFEMLEDYEISVSYIDSELETDTIVYTTPKANAIVYEGQMVTIFVSKGNSDILYKDLKNQMLDEVEEYINQIKSAYNLNVIITYKEDENLLDGLIYDQIIDDIYINNNDKLELIVGKNNMTVIIPSFIGWHYQDVINYANKNNLRIEIEYISFLYDKDYVLGQSVSSGTEVMKNSNPILIYLAN